MAGAKIMKNQQGATLIMVLFTLVLITIIGAYAVKQSASDIGVTTSAQIKELLFQSSELSLAKIEQDSREGDVSLLPSNFRGYVYADGMENREVIFCLRPRQAGLFNTNKVSERLLGTTASFVNGVNNGFCDPTKDADYVNARKTAVTQVYANKLIGAECAGEVFGCELDRTKSGDVEISGSNRSSFDNDYIEVESISLIPAFANSTQDTANCLSGQSREDTPSCLSDLGVPNQRHYQLYKSYVKGFDNV